jgi:hypothetical protein
MEKRQLCSTTQAVPLTVIEKPSSTMKDLVETAALLS